MWGLRCGDCGMGCGSSLNYRAIPILFLLSRNLISQPVTGCIGGTGPHVLRTQDDVGVGTGLRVGRFCGMI